MLSHEEIAQRFDNERKIIIFYLSQLFLWIIKKMYEKSLLFSSKSIDFDYRNAQSYLNKGSALSDLEKMKRL